MSEANQTAKPTDAREASMSRVQTMDSVMAKLAPADPPKTDPASQEVDPAAEPKDGQKPKKGFNERISEVIAQRKASDEKVAQAERENAELRAQVEALRVKAEPITPTDRPQRTAHASQEAYEDALTDWKADQRIAERERAHAEAQAKADMNAIEGAYTARIEAAKLEIDDFEAVISASEITISDVAAMAIKRSKEGPQLLYFLAKHPEEAKKVNRMHAIDAVGYLKDLGRELVAEATPAVKTVERSKAPEPITPVRQSQALSQGPASSFEEHRARRKAEQDAKRK